jgi:hypothetical protein
MHRHSSPAPKGAARPRRSSIRFILLAIMALATVALALSHSAPFSGQRTGAVFAAATVPSASHAGGGAVERPGHEAVPLFFGFLEFDWEPGRIPGFGPMEQAPRQAARGHRAEKCHACD